MAASKPTPQTTLERIEAHLQALAVGQAKLERDVALMRANVALLLGDMRVKNERISTLENDRMPKQRSNGRRS